MGDHRHSAPFPTPHHREPRRTKRRRHTLITTLVYEHLRFTLNHATGTLDTWRNNQPHTLNSEAIQAARLAIAKANHAYGYAYGVHANRPAPATRAQLEDHARAFAHAYAQLVYRARGVTWLNVADAYATWTATNQLDQIGPQYRHRHTHPTSHTLAAIRDDGDWPEGTQFVAIEPNENAARDDAEGSTAEDESIRGRFDDDDKIE
jgi:hypothetical protein